MTNKWLSRVTGQAVEESSPVRKPSALRQVLGEADEEKDAKPDKPEKAEPKEQPKQEQEPLPAPATDEPDDKPEAAVDADIEAGAEASADSSVDSQTVEHLVSSWESGSKMDVASQLMYTPVSYVDFVKMLFRIGEESGVELGGMLDQLSEVRPSIDQQGVAPEAPEAPQGGAERVLSRIAQRRAQDLPVAEPAGETSPELDAAP